MGSDLGTVLALAIRQSRILLVDLDGGTSEVLLDLGGGRPDGIVVHDGSMYWTTMGEPTFAPDQPPSERTSDYSARNGGVHAADLGGGRRRDVLAPGRITTGKQLALAGGWLYWGDREGHRVSRVRLDGTDQQDVVVNDGSGGVLDECVGVAVDPVRGHLYWTQKGPAKGGRGRILRAGLELPAGQSAAGRSDIETLWDGLPEPIDLEIAGGRLYWTDRGAPPDGNTLNRAPLPGPGAVGEAPQVLLGGFREAIGLAVDEARGWVHVSDLGGVIRSVPLPEGPAHAEAVRVVEVGTPLTGVALWPGR